MKIPDRLLVQITLFVSDHYHGNGLRSSPQMMGSSCGELASEWLNRPSSEWRDDMGSQVLLVSTCQRLGKLLGEFHLSEGEG